MTTVILSGGNGTRLKPLTDKIQKTMVPINDKPLLWYHINHLRSHGIKNVWLTLHKFPESVIEYFGNGSKFKVKINYSIEQEPLGTSGAIKNPNSQIEKSLRKGRFLIVYGDNLTNFDYSSLLKFHLSKKSFVTIGLYKSNEPWTGGMIQTHKNGKVKKAIEKPPKEKILTNTISAGVMVCEPNILDYIPQGFSDFGFDILPKLINLKKSIFAMDTGSYVQDCGTMERLSKAQKDYLNKKVIFGF